MNVFGVESFNLFTRTCTYLVSKGIFDNYAYVRSWGFWEVSWTTHIYVFGSEEVKDENERLERELKKSN